MNAFLSALSTTVRKLNDTKTFVKWDHKSRHIDSDAQKIRAVDGYKRISFQFVYAPLFKQIFMENRYGRWVIIIVPKKSNETRNYDFIFFVKYIYIYTHQYVSFNFKGKITVSENQIRSVCLCSSFSLKMFIFVKIAQYVTDCSLT